MSVVLPQLDVGGFCLFCSVVVVFFKLPKQPLIAHLGSGSVLEAWDYDIKC